MLTKEERREQVKKFNEMKAGTIRIISNDGIPQHLEITCDGIPMMAKSLTIPRIHADSGLVTAIVELYIDDLDIELSGAQITFTSRGKPKDNSDE